MFAQPASTRTAIVVVFIPPAVEPGEPPMSIKMMLTRYVTGEDAARSMEFIPAVLADTEAKNELIILSKIFISPRVVLYSAMNIRIVPAKRRHILVKSAILEWSLYL